MKTNDYFNDSKRRKRRLALSAVKKRSTLLKGITSKHHGDFYCFNCLYSFRTENKLKSHEKVCKNRIAMPSEKDKMLKIN